MFAEEGFWLLHLLAVDKAHMSDTTVGKAVYNGSSEPFGEIVVDECSNVGAYSSEYNHQYEGHSAVWVHGFPCSRWHNNFRREWNERTLYSHKQRHNPIVEVVENPQEKIGRIHFCIALIISIVTL